MSDDLVKRANEACGHDGGPELVDLIIELADRIKALTAERDYTEGTNDTLIALNQSLTADNARLREMVQASVNFMNGDLTVSEWNEVCMRPWQPPALEEIGQLQARVEDQAREIADLTRQLQGQPRRLQDVAGHD